MLHVAKLEQYKFIQHCVDLGLCYFENLRSQLFKRIMNLLHDGNAVYCFDCSKYKMLAEFTTAELERADSQWQWQCRSCMNQSVPRRNMFFTDRGAFGDSKDPDRRVDAVYYLKLGYGSNVPVCVNIRTHDPFSGNFNSLTPSTLADYEAIQAYTNACCSFSQTRAVSMQSEFSAIIASLQHQCLFESTHLCVGDVEAVYQAFLKESSSAAAQHLRTYSEMLQAFSGKKPTKRSDWLPFVFANVEKLSPIHKVFKVIVQMWDGVTTVDNVIRSIVEMFNIAHVPREESKERFSAKCASISGVVDAIVSKTDGLQPPQKCSEIWTLFKIFGRKDSEHMFGAYAALLTTRMGRPLTEDDFIDALQICDVLGHIGSNHTVFKTLVSACGENVDAFKIAKGIAPQFSNAKLRRHLCISEQ